MISQIWKIKRLGHKSDDALFTFMIIIGHNNVCLCLLSATAAMIQIDPVTRTWNREAVSKKPIVRGRITTVMNSRNNSTARIIRAATFKQAGVYIVFMRETHSDMHSVVERRVSLSKKIRVAGATLLSRTHAETLMNKSWQVLVNKQIYTSWDNEKKKTILSLREFFWTGFYEKTKKVVGLKDWLRFAFDENHSGDIREFERVFLSKHVYWINFKAIVRQFQRKIDMLFDSKCCKANCCFPFSLWFMWSSKIFPI